VFVKEELNGEDVLPQLNVYMKRKEIILVLILALVQFTNIVDFMIVMPLGPVLKKLWGIDSTQFSRIVSIFSVGAFISSMACLAYVDRFDRKKVLLVVYAGFTVGTFLCGLSQSYHQLLAARFLTGLFGGIGGSTILSMVGDYVAAERRGQAMGLLMTGFACASIVGVPGGLWLAGHYVWHTPFIVLASLCTIVFVLAAFIIPSFTNHLKNGYTKQTAFTIITNIFRDRNKRLALLLSSLLLMSHFSIIPFLTDFFTYNLGVNYKTDIPLIYIAGGLLSVFISPMVGKLSDKYGRFLIFAILSILSTIPLLCIPNMSGYNFWLLLSLFSTLFIFSGTRMVVANAQVTSTASMQERGSFLIVNSSILQLSTGVIAAVGGAIVSNDGAKRIVDYPILGIIGVVFGIMALLVFRKIKVNSL
jgi:MFS transporter, DHA1 family, inner membrane transport protein